MSDSSGSLLLREAVGTSPSFCRRRSVTIAHESDSLAEKQHQAKHGPRWSQRLTNKAFSVSIESQIGDTAQRQVCTRSDVCDWLSANISYEKTTKRRQDPENPWTDKPKKRPRRSGALLATPTITNTQKRRTQLLTESFKQISDPEEDSSTDTNDWVSNWVKEMVKEQEEREINNKTQPPLAKTKPPVIRRKRSDVLSAAPSDQSLPQEKSSEYKSRIYPAVLEEVGRSFLHDHEYGISDDGQKLLHKLLGEREDTPKGTRFDHFKKMKRSIRFRNEDYIRAKISPLLVASAEDLALFGDEDVGCVLESVNDAWDDSCPVTKERPQPDWACGFCQSTFSEEQFSKLLPFLSGSGSISVIKGTFYQYFPFLTKEMKCGPVGLFAAENQNAHSMTVAGNAIVALFRAAGRQNELHRQPIGFSVSHDQSRVTIHCHYPYITGDTHETYRHTVAEFILDDQNKWLSWTLIRNLYQEWIPGHIASIRSAIDDLLPSNSVQDQTSSDIYPSGLSQGSGIQNLSVEPPQVRQGDEGQPITSGSSGISEPRSTKKARTGKGKAQTGKGKTDRCGRTGGLFRRTRRH